MSTKKKNHKYTKMYVEDIFYSQTCIPDCFYNGNPLVMTSTKNFPPMEVVNCDSKWYSLNNRSLYVYRTSKTTDVVKVEVVQQPEDFFDQFDCEGDGTSVKLRGERSNMVVALGKECDEWAVLSDVCDFQQYVGQGEITQILKTIYTKRYEKVTHLVLGSHGRYFLCTENNFFKWKIGPEFDIQLRHVRSGGDDVKLVAIAEKGWCMISKSNHIYWFNVHKKLQNLFRAMLRKGRKVIAVAIGSSECWFVRSTSTDGTDDRAHWSGMGEQFQEHLKFGLPYKLTISGKDCYHFSTKSGGSYSCGLPASLLKSPEFY